jgi:hypothetical protein
MHLALATLLSVTALPPARMAQLMARSIGYDKNLKGRAGDKLVVALVYNAKDTASAQHCAEMEQAFSTLRGVRVQGVPLDFVTFAYDKSFAAAVKTNGVAVIYVCPNIAEVKEIAALSQKTKRLTIAGDDKDVAKGLTLGAQAADDKVTLMINRSAAKAEGAEFAEQILNVAKLVD